MRWRICECNYGYKNWEQVILCGKLCTERSLLLSDLFCSSTCLWRCWRHDLHDTGHLEWLVLAQFCILTSCRIFLLFPRIKTGWIPLSILLFKSLSWHCATSADFCLIRVESSWGGFRDCPGFVKKCFFWWRSRHFVLSRASPLAFTHQWLRHQNESTRAKSGHSRRLWLSLW